MPDAAEFDFLVVLYDLESDLSASVADGVIDLTKTAATGCPLNGVTLQWAISVFVLKSVHPGPLLNFNSLCDRFLTVAARFDGYSLLYLVVG